MRIYKVKDLDNLNRDHADAVAFEAGKKKKTKVGGKGRRELRLV